MAIIKTTEDGWTTFDENATTRKYVLPSSDRVAGGGHTHLAVFLNNPDLEDVPEELKRVPIVVHPRDCVSKEYLRDNIKQNMSLLDKDKWIEIEEFISEKGHEPSTCEWMVHNGEPIKFYYT